MNAFFYVLMKRGHYHDEQQNGQVKSVDRFGYTKVKHEFNHNVVRKVSGEVQLHRIVFPGISHAPLPVFLVHFPDFLHGIFGD